MSQLTPDQVKKTLSQVNDPVLDKGLVSHRFFKSATVDGGKVEVEVVIPAHTYPESGRELLTERIVGALEGAGAETVEVVSEVVTAFVPAPSEKAILPKVKNIIAVAAGKGGVGKSTVATNLALALHRHGASVGLLDADVFGPSIPQMLGEPEAPTSGTADKRIIPATHYGIKVMSVGFFIERDQAVIWRGPVVHRLLTQFLEEVEWGELDYLICDLPPGTGDVQLSLSQLIPVAGSVMVTTPQAVSVSDVIKGIGMFKETEIPILGLIENMSYYKCPECGHRDEIFAHGGGRDLAKASDIDFLGEIGIDTRIRAGGDEGRPIVISDPHSELATTFMDMAARVTLELAGRCLAKPQRSPSLRVLQ